MKEKLQLLSATKGRIKAALIDHGAQIEDSEPFAEYPSKIDEISGDGNQNPFKNYEFVKDWVLVRQPLTNEAVLELCYGNGVLVMTCNEKGAVIVSDDGVSFEFAEMPNSSITYPVVTFGNGKFVAANGLEGVGAYSYDGRTWYPITFPVSFTYGADIAAGNGMFVLIERSSAGLVSSSAYSTDGIVWEVIKLPLSGYWWSVYFINDRFFVFSRTATQRFCWSYNGIDWDSSLRMPTSSTYLPVYAWGKYYMFARTTARYYTTTDLLEWDEHVLSSNYAFNGAVFLDDVLVLTSGSISGSVYCIRNENDFESIHLGTSILCGGCAAAGNEIICSSSDRVFAVTFTN